VFTCRPSGNRDNGGDCGLGPVAPADGTGDATDSESDTAADLAADVSTQLGDFGKRQKTDWKNGHRFSFARLRRAEMGFEIGVKSRFEL